MGTPSTSTAQQPQLESSQPRLEPVSPRSSRNASSKRRLGATAISRSSPLTRRWIISLFTKSPDAPSGLSNSEWLFPLPHWLTLFHKCANALGGIVRFHQAVQVKIFHGFQRAFEIEALGCPEFAARHG